MLAASFILSLTIPKPKQKTEKDPTSPNAQPGTPLNRVFGTAIVGGTVIDSTTPEVGGRTGKGGLGGGKNRGEIKSGTFQVLIGEGERAWNDCISVIEPALPIQKNWEQSLVPARGLREYEEYRVTSVNTGNDAFDDYLISFSRNSGGWSLTSTCLPGTPAFVDHGNDCLIVISDPSWTIPPSDHTDFTSINLSFTIPHSLINNRFNWGIGLIQNGRVFFRGYALGLPYVHFVVGDFGGDNYSISIARSTLLGSSLNWSATDSHHNTNPSQTPDFSGSGSPVQVCFVVAQTNGGANLGVNATASFTGLDNINFFYSVPGPTGGELSLDTIYMNDEIWWEANPSTDESLELSQQNAPYFTFYPGSQNQQQDASLVALRGADKVPGLAGYSHIVFNNMPLDAWNNNYPTVKVKVTSSLSATPEVILRDLLTRAGVKHNAPLLEGIDWSFALDDDGQPLITPSTYEGVDIDGWVITFDSSDLKTALSEISQIFRISIGSIPSLNYLHSPAFTGGHRQIPLYKVVPVNLPQTIDVEAETIGMDTLEDSLPWPSEIEGKSGDEIPGEVEVQYKNNNKGGETESVLVDRSTFQTSGTYTFTSNYYADRKEDTANSIANFILYQGLARAKQTITRLIPNALGELQALVSWADRLTLRPQKLTFRDDGVVEVVGININSDLPAGTITPDPVNDVQTPQGVPLETEAIWLEGPAYLTPSTGNQETVYALIAPKGGSTALPTTLVYSTDGGGFTTSNIENAETNAVILNIVEINNAVEGEYRLFNKDTIGTITVEVSPGVNLQSASDNVVIAGTKNILYIESVGFVGFTTPTLIAANTYELSGLYWNMGQSAMDVDWRGNASPTINRAWLLTGSLYELYVGAGIATKNAPFYTRPINTSSSGLVYSQTYEALNSSPRHVSQFRISVAPNEDILLAWSPEIEQTTLIVPPLFEDVPVSSPTYSIRIYKNGGLVRSVTGHTSNSYVYTKTDQTADGVASNQKTLLTYKVVQEGFLNTMGEAIQNSYNWRGQLV